jgi:uncharacterized membrane protein
MALAADRFAAVAPAWAIWLRLPLQLPLIWWVGIAAGGWGAIGKRIFRSNR